LKFIPLYKYDKLNLFLHITELPAILVVCAKLKHSTAWYPEKSTDLPQVTLSHNVVSSTPRYELDSNTTFVAIATNCIGGCKSNYHTIMTTTAPLYLDEE
jgi:hypothetical protein